ncbi:OmpA family protein [Aquabacterium sp. OR-4]|uniref:OmpA family protein n=1 Tax=Aquabacterium sp. OR-4 TaxID=2978127 RepID=UPI0021B33A59|nr:OmpA family protein [Aquabacterium sp. OR-4]MDT7836207.1 OmpA family protein [Aquabacterium sp. OR-4]
MSQHPRRPAPQRHAGALLLALVAVLGAGCASVTDRVVLLPQPDGRPSAVEVKAGSQRLLLAQPYAAAELKGQDLQPVTLDAATVAQRYGELLASQPPRPQRFVVRFESNGNRLTPESAPVLDDMRKALSSLQAPEVIVTGHTDRVGSLEANDRLSVVRAEALREILIEAGLPRAAITVIGRGEREPEVPTDDEVAEPRNRRVEIKLR